MKTSRTLRTLFFIGFISATTSVFAGDVDPRTLAEYNNSIALRARITKKLATLDKDSNQYQKSKTRLDTLNLHIEQLERYVKAPVTAPTQQSPPTNPSPEKTRTSTTTNSGEATSSTKASREFEVGSKVMTSNGSVGTVESILPDGRIRLRNGSSFYASELYTEIPSLNNVAAGTRILSSNGTMHTVMGVFSKGNSYRVKTVTGESFYSSEIHYEIDGFKGVQSGTRVLASDGTQHSVEGVFYNGSSAKLRTKSGQTLYFSDIFYEIDHFNGVRKGVGILERNGTSHSVDGVYSNGHSTRVHTPSGQTFYFNEIHYRVDKLNGISSGDKIKTPSGNEHTVDKVYYNGSYGRVKTKSGDVLYERECILSSLRKARE